MITKPIRVGYVDYSVELSTSLPEDDYGMCDPHMKCIYISTDQGPRSAADTYLHELLHAIWFESGLFKVKRADEEHIVHTTATWLTIVMQNNPHVTAILQNPEQYWNNTPTAKKGS